MTALRVSVVVRSMARPTLSRALAALAAQDHPHVEVVVVNALGVGHAPPPAVLGAHAVRYVDGSSRRTRPQAANAGLDAASGDWITFLDDDDTLSPEHISGLVAATGRAGACRLVHTRARAVLANGGTQYFGQPMALVELHRRNFIHMSSALWSRDLVAEGARFDERCTTHQDWDFFLQCAQRTRFHYEPLATFQWHADAGESGSWGDGNYDDVQVRAMCALVHDKWAAARDALMAIVVPLRRASADRAQARDVAGARAAIAELLDVSQNDPFGLSLLAGVERLTGNLAAALRAQRLAVAVRPQDATLVFGLALIQYAQGQLEQARDTSRRALALAPEHEGASKLLAHLAPR